MEKLSDMFSIPIDNKVFFEHALTHPSYAKENNLDYTCCYERLEFLGDAVLKLAISDILYNKYPRYPEGNLSKIRSIIVSDATLFEICESIGLSELIILSRHEEKQGCRRLESVCAFEAVLGAYYLDGKFNELKDFIEEKFNSYIEDVDKNFEKFNAKALLQEYTQGKSKEVPEYKLVNESGPAHKKIFEVEVWYAGSCLAKGVGKTKKEAEEMVAYEASIKMGIR